MIDLDTSVLIDALSEAASLREFDQDPILSSRDGAVG